MAITAPVLGGTTMAQVGHRDSYSETLELRGGDIITANGTMLTDLVQSSAKRKFELKWVGLDGSAGIHHRNGMGNGQDGYRVVHQSPRRHVHGDARHWARWRSTSAVRQRRGRGAGDVSMRLREV